MRLSTYGSAVLAVLLTVGAGCASSTPAPSPVDVQVESTTPGIQVEVNGSEGAMMPADDSAAGGTMMEGEKAEGGSEMMVGGDAKTDNMTEGVKSFTVIGENFSYDLKEMKVKKGDKVRVTFRNNEGFHDWNLDEFGAKTNKLQANDEETIEFVADKAGTFEYYCSVGSHRAMGMVGKLIVE